MGAWNCFQRAIIDEGDTNKCWKAWASFTWRPDSSCCRWICMCYLKLLNIVPVTEFHIWCFILLWLFLFLRNHVSENCLTNFSIRQAIWLHVNSLQRIFALDILEWEIYLCSQHFIFLCYILKLLDFLGVSQYFKIFLLLNQNCSVSFAYLFFIFLNASVLQVHSIQLCGYFQGFGSLWTGDLLWTLILVIFGMLVDLWLI